MQAILPLKLDLGDGEMHVPGWLDALFDLFYNPSGARRKEINRQLELRPEVWGVGLWPDEKSESIARKIGELICRVGGLKRNAFIPDDPLIDINAIEYEWGLFADVSGYLNQDFGCWIAHVEWEDLTSKTFGDLVRIVKEREGTSLRSECVPFSMVGWFKTFGLNWLAGWLSWLFIIFLLAVTFLLVFVVMRSCGLDDERVLVTCIIWAVLAVAFAVWKGCKSGVLKVLYYLALIGFCAGALWHLMSVTPVDKIISDFR